MTLESLFHETYRQNFVDVWGELFEMTSIEQLEERSWIYSFNDFDLEMLRLQSGIELTALRTLRIEVSIYNYEIALEFASSTERDALLNNIAYRHYQKIGKRFAIQKSYFIESYLELGSFFLSNDRTTLLRSKPSKDLHYTVPEGVTHIGDRAFSNAVFRSISLPDTSHTSDTPLSPTVPS